MNQSSPKRVLRRCGLVAAGAVLLLIGCMLGLGLVQKFYGGPHVTTAGEAYGFKIGMTKEAVFQRYRELDEAANIRSYGPEGTIAIERKSSDLKFSKEFQHSNHWKAYRGKFPIWFQEFYFENGKLTNITTYIRVYETP